VKKILIIFLSLTSVFNIQAKNALVEDCSKSIVNPCFEKSIEKQLFLLNPIINEVAYIAISNEKKIKKSFFKDKNHHATFFQDVDIPKNPIEKKLSSNLSKIDGNLIMSIPFFSRKIQPNKKFDVIFLFPTRCYAESYIILRHLQLVANQETIIVLFDDLRKESCKAWADCILDKAIEEVSIHKIKNKTLKLGRFLFKNRTN
jgi:hypothetical protein